MTNKVQNVSAGVRSNRVGRIVLVVTLLAGVLAVSFGAGYRSSRAVLADGSAYLPRGHTVTHVNGETGLPDAELQFARTLATGKQKLEVVQTPSGGVYVVNNDTGEVTALDTSRMAPDGSVTRVQSKGKVEVLPVGSEVYLVDRARDTIDLVDPRTLQARRTQPVPGGIDGAVADRFGVAWVFSRGAGMLLEIRQGVTRKIHVVTKPGARGYLTSIEGAPVLVRPDDDSVVRIEGGEPVTVRAEIPGDRELVVGQPDATGSVLCVVAGVSRSMLLIDPASGHTRAVPLNAGDNPSFGAPVALGGTAYLPHYPSHRVLVVDVARGVQVGTIPVPGRSAQFSTMLRGGKVWFSDQYERRAIVADINGEHETVDKGADRDVTDSRRSEQQPDPPNSPRAPAGVAPAKQPSTRRPPPAAVITTIPEIAGAEIGVACSRLAKAKLRCERLPLGDDGRGETGEVLGSDPPAGRRIEQGTAVKVRYRGPLTVASYVGRPIADVCASLTQQRLRCQQRSLGPTDSADKAGLVVEQDPAPGGQVETGTTITLSFHDAVAVPTGLDNLPISDACARVQAAGFTCTPRDLGSAAGTGRQPGVVISVEPGQGTNATPRSAVTLSAYNANGQPVPSVAGLDVGTACAQIQQAGYVCDQRADRPWRTPNVVASQDQAAGTVQGIGAPVVVHYYNVAPQVLRRWKASGEAVWVVTADPNRPLAPGYIEEGPVGVAFSPYTGGPGLVPLVSWNCPAGADCGGHNPAHFYAPAGVAGPPGWTTTGGYAAHVVAAPGGACDSAAGLVPLYRLVRTSKGTVDFAYAASGGELGYYQGIEFTPQAVLGCVWTQ